MKLISLALLLCAGAFAQSGIINPSDGDPSRLMNQIRRQQYQTYQQQPYQVQPLPQVQVPQVQMPQLPQTYTYQRYGNTGYLSGSNGTNCTVQYVGQYAYTTCN